MYDAGDDRLLMVASDRVSAFDVVMGHGVPRKGEVLTLITAWWLQKAAELDVRHHAITADPDEIEAAVPKLADSRQEWARRSILVHRTRPIPVECVVRGYLAGSAWREYRDRGTLAGEPLPPGLTQSQRLDPPIFSPATKAEEGHDENITFAQVEDRVGRERARTLRDLSLTLFGMGARVALRRDIILADTKFEFGEDEDGALVLIDEILTPDSSRYWPVEGYQEGHNPPSLDKQPVRDFLDGIENWNRRPPPPPLPSQVIQATTDRYLEIFQRLTGQKLDDYSPPSFVTSGPDHK